MGFVPRAYLWGTVLITLLYSRPTAAAEIGGYVKPAACSSFQCPSYRVIHTQQDFEIRSYARAVWMSTPVINATSYTAASMEGFRGVYSYIQGKNDRAAKMEMTAPVLVDVAPSAGPFCKSSFVVRFYVPREHQRAPPGSRDVHPEMWPGPGYAAVRRFGGFTNDTNVPLEAAALRSSLRRTRWGGRAGPAGYTVAGYNSPFDLVNRVNEVMFLL